MKGILLTIEGTDGTGKATQTKILGERIEAAGRQVVPLAFPRYNEESSWFVRQYLAGAFGAAHEVSPKIAASLFAFDRLQASPYIRSALDQGAVVILDRWVSANKGHQLGKLDGHDERQEFLNWLNHFEYEENRVPVPDLTLLLDLDPQLARRDSAAKGGVVTDIHEHDIEHLRRAREAYRWVVAHDTVERWQPIPCADEVGQRFSVEQVHTAIWQAVCPLLQNAR